MRALLVALAVLSVACGGGGRIIDGSSMVEVETNVRDVFFGDPQASPLEFHDVDLVGVDIQRGGVPDLGIRWEGTRPTWLPTVDPIPLVHLYELEGEVTEAGVVSFQTPVVVPMTGSFRLFIPTNEVGITGYTSLPFDVVARQPAYVQCLDLNTIAGASTQTPPATRLRFGRCTMTRGGGDNVGSRVASASCTSAKGRTECEASSPGSTCLGATAPTSERLVAGDAVTAAWSGGDVAAGSAELVVPASVDFDLPPSAQPRSQPLSIAFRGTSPEAEAGVTLYQTVTGSLVAVDCEVPATSGTVTIPAEMLELLQVGSVDVFYQNRAVRRVSADPYQVEVSAPGEVTVGGAIFTGGLSLTLE